MPTAIIHGDPAGLFATLPRALTEAGFTIAHTPPATLLINLTTDAEAAIASAAAFADAVPEGQEALVVNILHSTHHADWPAERAAATLWAFTRHAALAWAPRRIRVNALGLGVSPVLPTQPGESAGQAAGHAAALPATPGDVANTVLAFWALPSITGQLIRLGAVS